jgi:PIN domain nuclease of toxin-antitoxin system
MSVLDASAIIAFLKREAGHELVADAVAAGAAACAANLAEVATVLVRSGVPRPEVRAILEELPVAVLDVDANLAIEAGLLYAATRSSGLSLGDRLCLATAIREGRPAMTADRAWSGVASLIGAEVTVIR